MDLKCIRDLILKFIDSEKAGLQLHEEQFTAVLRAFCHSNKKSSDRREQKKNRFPYLLPLQGENASLSARAGESKTIIQ